MIGLDLREGTTGGLEAEVGGEDNPDNLGLPVGVDGLAGDDNAGVVGGDDKGAEAGGTIGGTLGVEETGGTVGGTGGTLGAEETGGSLDSSGMVGTDGAV